MIGWVVLFVCLFLSMYEYLSAYMYTVCVPDAHGGQKRALRNRN